MTVNDVASAQNFYNDSIRSLGIELALAKERNGRLEDLKREKEEVDLFSMQVQSYWENLALVRMAVIKESTEFQTRRIEYLNTLITDALREIFPNESYSAKVSYDYSRKDTVKLTLRDKSGKVSTPRIGQGLLMQYVISFAAITGIAKGLGIKSVFVDEAFGVASSDKLEDLGKVVQSQIDSGMQVILVSQNESLYRNLSRREFQLEKNAETGISSLVKIEDYGGSV